MTEIEDRELLKKLKSNNKRDVYDALVKIRKNYARNFDKMRRLVESSIIKLLISFIEDPRYCNISLSIIADACLEKNIIFEFIQNGGIQSLMRIMKSLVNDDVQNRACRALGNIAKSEIGLRKIHNMKPVSNILQFLSGTSDKNCQQTAIRTLRILGRDSKSRDLIVRENGIIYIAKLLSSSCKDVLLCTTKALAELSENCTISCARQMLEVRSIQLLVELYSHSEKNIRAHALTSLKNLSGQEEIRPDLVKVGAVKLFTEIAMSSESSEMSRLAALALCSCLDHIHMWGNYGVSKHDGLKAILEVLRRSICEDIHTRIIISLIPLCYESGGSEMLFDLEIIQILIKIFENFIINNKTNHLGPVPNSESLTEIKSPTSPPPLGLKPASDDELSCNSIDSLCSIDNNSLLTKTFSKGPKCNRQISCLDFEHFSPVNLPNATSPVKNFSKFDHSSYWNLHSSGASSYCSPSSSGSNTAASPKFFSDFSSSFPIADPWSPHSNTNEDALCWSPVLSCSDMSNPAEIETEMTVESKMETCQNNDICAPPNDKQQSSVISINTKMFSSCDKHSVPTSDTSNKTEITHISTHIMDTVNQKHSIQKTSDDDNDCSALKKHKIDDNIQTTSDENAGNKKIKTVPQLTNVIYKDLNETFSNRCEKGSIDHHILSLLTQLSFHSGKKCNSEIAGRACFSVLMDYMYFIPNPSPKAEKFLLNLVKNRYSFEKLIMSGFVAEMENRIAVVHDPKVCIRCCNLNNTYQNLLSAVRQEAESDYGVGTLCHILSTAEKGFQIHAIHAISKLIVLKSALFKLIILGNGLSILLKFLTDETETTSSSAIIYLCQLYQNLKKTKTNETFEKCCFSGTCAIKVVSKCAYKDALSDVTFCVKGINISASRETICHNSEYFKALLMGHFLENKKETIIMPEISAETLTTIFHFLHGCKTESCCPYIKRIPFAVLLELLSECEKFLLYDVKAYVEDRLCHSLFPNTVPKIYEAAKIFNSPALHRKALHFVMSMDVAQKDILLKCFKEFMNLERDFNFLSDVRFLVKSVFPESNHYPQFKSNRN